MCLEQHKTWLHIKTIVNAGWVRFMPGGAQWRSGGQHSINEAIIQMKNFKKNEQRRMELLVTLPDIVQGSQ